MNILLILAKDNQYRYKGSFKKTISWAPLTLATLAAMVPKELNAKVDIVDEGVEHMDYNQKAYDIVGISCCTSSALRAYDLCEFFKRKNTFVVLGGSHPTLMPEEASQHADAIVTGPADVSWPQLLFDFIEGKTKKRYVFDPSHVVDPPHPRRDLLKKKVYQSVPTIYATMGCGNKCNFCSINKIWCKHYTRDIEDVIEDIKNTNSKTVIFLDPNLTYDKEYAKKLFEAMIPLKIKWASACALDIFKDKELLSLIVRSGCIGVLIGFESFSQKSIEMSGKDKNNVQTYKEAVDMLNAFGIVVFGTFVLGLDGDNKESLLKTLEYIDALNIAIPRYSVLTPYPGTPLFDKLKKEDRILTENWSYYDQQHVVFKPLDISPGELQKLQYHIWRKSYSFKRIYKRTVNTGHQKIIALYNNLNFWHYAKILPKTSYDYLIPYV